MRRRGAEDGAIAAGLLEGWVVGARRGLMEGAATGAAGW